MSTKTKVPFQLTAPTAKTVFVAGSFNDWNPTQFPLKQNAREGRFSATLRLPPGRHEYRFIVDGEWRTDPASSESAPNPFGASNSVCAV